ncbi:PREDICTED: uncharacterized protein LOC107065973 isoform X2 [Polistes dominula]|nr:PREDICTED: uncharacterized protein LOC107065973 isoform X2 [Polistes dominula]XP_015175622.1 PREDICTED: uncharacterized protein LOC107065973 isoform X2 [Polistes dominula]
MAGVSAYLDAIQAIKGINPSQKYETIMEHIKMYLNVETKELNSEIWENTEINLQPFYKLIIANMIESYDMITELLKSEDTAITTRVLKCRWYFQGTNENIINPEYFFQNIIPYVTLKTRREIVKSLGRNLKNAKMAEQFFIVFEENYGASYSLPLLFACTDTFFKNKILQHRIILSLSQVERLYLRKPNVVIYYFNLIKSRDNKKTSVVSNKDINLYFKFLPKLIKRNHNLFYDIIETWGSSINSTLQLNKKYAQHLVKRGKNNKSILEEDPCKWIKFIELEMISETIMNTIFPKLLPEDIDDFNTDVVIRYLKYYPKDKVYKLISESYEIVYKEKFLDKLTNVTMDFLPYLPTNIRIDILPSLKLHFRNSVNDYEKNYDSYLPTRVLMKKIKKEINETNNPEDRVALVIQMIYNCKINKDSAALCQFLNHVYNRHKNEIQQFWITFFRRFAYIYKWSELKLNEWSCIDKLIIHVYSNLMLTNIYQYPTILKESILFKYKNISNYKVAEVLIHIYLTILRDKYEYDWSRYIGEPQDEVLFFNIMLDSVEKLFTKVQQEFNTNIDTNEDNTKLNVETDNNSNSNMEEQTLSSNSSEQKIWLLESNSDDDSNLKVEINLALWNNDKIRIRFVLDLVKNMYRLDDEYAPYINKKKKILKQKLLREPFKKWKSTWLWLQVEYFVKNEDKLNEKAKRYLEDLKECLKKDPELYEKLLNKSVAKKPDVKYKELVQMLKRNPEKLLNEIELFLDTAYKLEYRNSGSLHRPFIMCRWYDKLPMVFIDEAKKRYSLDNHSFYIYLMAIILDGQGYQNISNEYLSNENVQKILIKPDNTCVNDTKTTKLLNDVLRGMHRTNPPVSLEIIQNFYEYELVLVLNILNVITNVCVNTSLNKVQRYLETNSNPKITDQKNVIRIYTLAETIEKCAHYYTFKWNHENEHSSIRGIIFDSSYKLFKNNPRQITWRTFKNCMDTFKYDSDWSDCKIEFIKTNVLPIEYINELIETMLSMLMKTIDNGNSKNQQKAMNFLERSFHRHYFSDYYASILNGQIILNFTEKYLFQENCLNNDLMIDLIISKYMFANSNEYLSRIKTFGMVFERICKEWYEAMLQNKKNHEYDEFLEKITKHMFQLKDLKINPITIGQIIDEIIRIFYKIPIYTNIWNYIMLIMTKYTIVTPDEFIENICNKLIEVCYENKCTFFVLANCIQYFYENFPNCVDNAEIYYLYIKRLLMNDNCNLSKLTAVQLLPLPWRNKEQYDKHCEIVEKLESYKDVEILCLLYFQMRTLHKIVDSD